MERNSYKLYVFILSFVVFVVLTVTFLVMLGYITRLLIQSIRGGSQDKAIIRQYKKQRGKKKKTGRVERWVGGVFCALSLFLLAFAVFVGICEDKVAKHIPVFRVVYSDSMSRKNEKNTYLFKNGLNDQFQKYDLIITRALPSETELELYDVVVYALEGNRIIHRIVGIEEPNEYHEERLFFLQGDAVDGRDKAPVTYAQMQGVYRGEKIPHVGSFILFLQSPIGYICVLGALLVMIITPFLDRKVEKAEEKRLQEILSARRQTQNTENHGDIGAPIVYYPVFYPVQTPVSSINDRGQNEKNE